MTDLLLLRRTLSAPAALAAPSLHRESEAPTPVLRRTVSAPAGLQARAALPTAPAAANLPPRATLLPRAASAPGALGAWAPGSAGEQEAAPDDAIVDHTAPRPTAPRPEQPRSTLRTASAWSAPVVDAAAAALSLASARLAAAPRAAQVTAAVSGSLWAGAGLVGEVGNLPHRAWATGANVFGAAAGVLSAAAPFTQGPVQRAVAYASAGAWAASGTVMVLGAVGATATHAATGLLQGVSGIANLAAAGLGAAAVEVSGRDADQAVRLQTASSALWLAGSAAAVGAVWAKTAQQRQREPLADPERG